MVGVAVRVIVVGTVLRDKVGRKKRMAELKKRKAESGCGSGVKTKANAD